MLLRSLAGDLKGWLYPVKKVSTRQLVFMAICLTFGLLAKRIVSPLTNTLTDFFRIPGGSAAMGFSLAFLIVGKKIVPLPFAATAMGFVQSLLALGLGMSGYQGAFAVITYTLPGVVIDILYPFIGTRKASFCFAAGILSCLTGAIMSNFLVFRLRGLSLLLWLLLAALSGSIGGYCAHLVSVRLADILKKEAR